jgi:thiamine-monophosphate kinase
MTLAQVQEVYLGAEEAGLAAGCPIVGGDFASWDGRLVVTVGILGTVDQPVLREGARPGQTLFVTGPLGGSILGRHITFKPRLDMGLRAATQFRASAMLDLSDGLSRDLPRLLGPSVGATIDAEDLPIHPDARQLARQTGRDPLWHALNDGEDYELLFAADADNLPGCTAIGRVEAGPGVRLRRAGQIEPLVVEGWEHRLSGSAEGQRT